MTAITAQRPRRGARGARRTGGLTRGDSLAEPSPATRSHAHPAPVGPAVILRLPPPLDPPVEEATPGPPPLASERLGYDMDQLPLEWPGTPPAIRPAARPRKRTVAQAPDQPSDAYAAAKRFVGLCVEILNGYRPPNQLRPLSHPQRFGDISDQILRRTVRIRMTPGQAASQGTLVRIRRLLVTEPLSGVAEGVVVLEHGTSTWAMALRFEHTDRPKFGFLGWVCTVVQVL
jgi:hypothetical protein